MNMTLLILLLPFALAHSESLHVTKVFRDTHGNLVATYRKAGFGPEGLMYCRQAECHDLITTQAALSNRDRVLDFKLNGEKDHAEVRMNSTLGRYKLTCPPERVVDLQPLPDKEIRSLEKKIEGGQLKWIGARAIRKAVFLYKVTGSAELIYQDTAESEPNDIYVGTPGKMVKIKSRPAAPQNRCTALNVCRDQYYTDVGAAAGSEDGKFLDVTAKKWGDDPIEPMTEFDVASLGIPGQPPTKDYNQINPCAPDGAAKSPAPARKSPAAETK